MAFRLRETLSRYCGGTWLSFAKVSPKQEYDQSNLQKDRHGWRQARVIDTRDMCSHVNHKCQPAVVRELCKSPPPLAVAPCVDEG